MQIEKIRFENLNSLVGHWEIDLTDPEYLSNGIFAIVGPTGSGKSTILDAISLALFSHTPRLEKIMGAGGSELMSRGTWYCSAEVEFCTENGRYRAQWSQSRKKKSPLENLDPIQRQISDMATGKILASQKIKEVETEIQKIIAMDFKEFSRSVLLAQGHFDSFLRANANERAPILEQITGTEIYSKISTAVYERKKIEEVKRDAVESEYDAISVLSEAEENELNENLTKIKNDSQALEKQAEKVTNQIDFWKRYEKTQQEMRQWEKGLENVKKQTEDFAKDALRLERFEKTKQITPQYHEFVQKKEALAKKTETLNGKENEKEKQASVYQLQKEKAESAIKEYEKIRDEKDKLQDILKTVREWDLHIQTQEKDIQSNQRDLNVKEAERVDSEKTIHRAKKELKKVVTKIQALNQYFQENAVDVKLQTQLSGLRERMDALNEIQNSFDECEKEYQSAIEELQKTQKPLKKEQENFYAKSLFSFPEERKDDLKALQHHFEQEKIKLEAEQERLTAEKISQSLIQSFEEHRKNLSDATPCPLCGSTEHPFAHGNVPHLDETQSSLKNVGKLLEELGKQMKSVQEIMRSKMNVEQKEKEMQRLEKNCSKLKKQLEKSQEKIHDEILEYEIDPAVRLSPVSFIPEEASSKADLTGTPCDWTGTLLFSESLTESTAQIIAELEKRHEKWSKNQNEHQELQKSETKLGETLNGANEMQTRLISDVAQINEKLEALESSCRKLKEERSNIFGNKNCDREEQDIKKREKDCQSKLDRRKKELEQTDKQLAGLRSEIQMLTQEIQTGTTELEKLREKIMNRIIELGFSDENDYIASRLCDEEFDTLSKRQLKLENEQVRLNGLLENSKKTFQQLQQEERPQQSREELEKRALEIRERKNKIIRETVEIEKRLEDNATNLEKRRKKEADLRAQQKEYSRFKNLNDLIGSASGDKFRKFAQERTLESLISHANRQLKFLRDRFVLVSGKQELEIEIRDLYQSEEIRSVKNLSGGERFLVSLSLALGLSEMLSKNTQVGSFFLDEGFGTLDEETLHTALEALSLLQQSGKLIGIISHVPALKERITTQIELRHLPGGRSEVRGPGVKKL